MMGKCGIRFACAVLLMFWTAPGMLRADITPATRWADPSRVKLDVEFPGDGYHAAWELYRCDCGDLLVHSELNVPGETEKGETLLVEGRAVLSRGFGEHQSELGASLDAPALMMQLALRLLERSQPGGPVSVTGSTRVDLVEQINHIHLDTGGAVGGFQAPWSVSGNISAPGGTQRRFDLKFTFTVGAPGEIQEASMQLRGLADFAETDFPLPGTTGLDDWMLFWRDENDPAAGAAKQAETLHELREVIQTN